MNELELIFQAESKKYNVEKTTVEEIERSSRRNARKKLDEICEKLAFVKKYGCKIEIDSRLTCLYIHYPKYGSKSLTRARLSFDTELKSLGSQRYTEWLPNVWLVNWDCDWCHCRPDQRITSIEDLVKSLVYRINNFTI